jgi:5-methylcytosine-specific restriction protein A
MPLSPLKPCAHPGCPELVRSGRCESHAQQRRVEQDRVYRDAESKRMYNSARWQMRRRLQLAAEPWCRECLAEGNYTPARQVDHIEPHRGDPVKFYTGPLQSLCDSCHSRKTAKEVFHANG